MHPRVSRILNFAVVGSLLLSSAFASMELLKPPPSANLEKGTTNTSLKGGRLRWKSQWTMERGSEQGPQTVRFTEKGSGRYSGFNQEVRWNTETIWPSGEEFRPLSIDCSVPEEAGKPSVI